MRKNRKLRKEKTRNFAVSTTPSKKHNQKGGRNHLMTVNLWWIFRKGLGFVFVCADPTLLSALWYSWSLCSGLINNHYKGKNSLVYEIKSLGEMLAREYWQNLLQDI